MRIGVTDPNFPDPTIDVAVVRVQAQNIPTAPLGDSDKLRVGQSAIATGIPLGLERTITCGVGLADIDSDLAREFGLPVRQGVIVGRVEAGSPAARAGLRPQDIIVHGNDTPITSGGDLRRLLRGLSPGTTGRLEVVRPSGRTTIPVGLGEAPT